LMAAGSLPNPIKRKSRTCERQNQKEKDRLSPCAHPKTVK
jgi:hypothetical protein